MYRGVLIGYFLSLYIVLFRCYAVESFEVIQFSQEYFTCFSDVRIPNQQTNYIIYEIKARRISASIGTDGDSQIYLIFLTLGKLVDIVQLTASITNDEN